MSKKAFKLYSKKIVKKIIQNNRPKNHLKTKPQKLSKKWAKRLCSLNFVSFEKMVHCVLVDGSTTFDSISFLKPKKSANTSTSSVRFSLLTFPSLKPRASSFLPSYLHANVRPCDFDILLIFWSIPDQSQNSAAVRGVLLLVETLHW